MTAKPLTASPRYRDFITGRDQALQRILGGYLGSLSRVMDAFLISIEACVRHRVPAEHSEFSREIITQISHDLGPAYQAAVLRTTELVRRLRTSTYALSRAGETEALARALGKNQRLQIQTQDFHLVRDRGMAAGGSLEGRVDLAYSKLFRRVLDAIQLTLVSGEGPSEAINRIRRQAFPRVVRHLQAPKVLRRPKPMREAGDDEGGKVIPFRSLGVVSEPEWKQTVKDYLEEEVPHARGPHDKLMFFDVSQTSNVVEFQNRYEWDLEQEVTHDFIETVRSGENAAAKENGIDDFQWVSLLDADTDECCRWRDGLTTSEIESALDGGEHADDQCDAVTAPAHFNCRCRMVPVSQDMPDEAPPDFGSFDDWMDEKAAA